MSSQSRRRGHRNLLLALTICAPLMAGAVTLQPPPYYIKGIQVVSLGTLGGNESVARDINDNGEIVGWAHGPTGVRKAFLYRSGSMESLPVTLQVYDAEAQGINNQTQVVGNFFWSADDARHGFYWDDLHPNGMLYEATSTQFNTGANPHAINDFGVIAGERWEKSMSIYGQRPVLWLSRTSTWEELLPIVVPPGSALAHNVNATGVIVGDDPLGYYSYSGAYYWYASVVQGVPVPAATWPQWWYPGTARAFGINSAGNIVGDMKMKPAGVFGTEVLTRATYWNGTSLAAQGLAVFSNGKNAGAYEINDQGFIAGWGDRMSLLVGLRKRAALWHRDIGITELPMPSGSGPGTLLSPNYCEAYAVNNRSATGLVQAVGYCRLDGRSTAILWNISTARGFVLSPIAP